MLSRATPSSLRDKSQEPPEGNMILEQSPKVVKWEAGGWNFKMTKQGEIRTEKEITTFNT